MSRPPLDRLGARETDLVTANDSFDTCVLPERTRFRWLKALVLRVLSLAARRQVSFNAAVVRILNDWNERLPRLTNEVAERFGAAEERARAVEEELRAAGERTDSQIAAGEERRAALEIGLSGSVLAIDERLRQLETRMSATSPRAPAPAGIGEPEPGGRPRPVAILVLGMHRSGTSALSGCLHRLGVPLGEPLLQADAANERGYWENGEIVAVHDELLASFGATALDLSVLPPAWPFGPAAENAREKLRLLIERNFSGRPLWAVKDPRLPVLLPLWLDLLREIGTEPRFAVILRDPWEVARSLETRHGLGPWGSLELWLRHTVEAERLTRGYRRTGVSYDELLIGPVPAMKRIGEELGVAWPRPLAEAGKEIDDFLEPALRHWRRPAPPASAPPDLVPALASVSERTLAVLRGGDRTALARLFTEVSRCESLLRSAPRPSGRSPSPALAGRDTS